MGDSIQAVIEECTCGHDKASHYLDRDTNTSGDTQIFVGKCLCRGCDTCRWFKDKRTGKYSTRTVK